MDKLPLTLLFLLVEFFLLLPVYAYHKNKKEYDRRYWGKNRTWLKNNRIMNITSAVILVVLYIAILLHA